jgi:nucleotide-binding universal stress UspA family protein
MVFREPVPAQQAHTIVVGIDGSPSSDYALELAQALALALEAALVLVHAYDPHIPFAVLTTEGMRNELHRHGRKLLAAARGRVVASLAVEEVLVEGSAREELLAACDRHAPSLLAVGSRGLGGFKELLLGSTSRSVANRASCPVLVARRACAP